MKKIDRQAANHLLAGKAKKLSKNTEVEVSCGVATLYLWGHPIAQHDLKTGEVNVNFCGHQTYTTKMRLNAVARQCGSVIGFFDEDFVTYAQHRHDNRTWEAPSREDINVRGILDDPKKELDYRRQFV